MRIAIVGAGIAGLTCAHLLHPEHEITVFEADARPGGHTRTVEVETPHGVQHVDTGFIVFNDRNYPGFERLLERLGVASQPSTMSFSVSDGRGGFEYNGASANGLFARRSSVLRPSFHRMVRDLVRFNREAPALVGLNGSGPTLLDFLDEGGYSREFVERLIVPQASAVWSADPRELRHFPASLLAEFFDNHGMFGLSGRPRWRTVRGGSNTLRRGAHRAAARAAAAGHAGGARGAPRRPRGGHAGRRQRPGALRRADPGRALRPVAGPARRPQPGRGRAARRDPLPAQRRGPAHRRLAAAAPPARLGELELPPPGRARRADHRHLPHEPPPVARRRARVLRHAQPARGHRPRAGDRDARVRPPRVHARARWRRSGAGPRSAACAARTTAARTGATASTRTGCRAPCASARASGRSCDGSTRAGCATAASAPCRTAFATGST